MAPIIVAATLAVASAILAESYISFLGLGVQPPTATWGNMLEAASSDFSKIENAPWFWLFPGLLIVLTVLSINFVGDGLRDAADLIEEAGVRITNRMLDQADLTLLVIDGSAGMDTSDEELCNRLREKKVIVACNKADLPRMVCLETIRAFLPESPIVSVSALRGTGIEALKEAVAGAVLSNGAAVASHTVITTLRHARALEQALETLKNAEQGLRDKIPPEFVASDLQLAAQRLGEITGASSSDEVLEGIFSRFCIGK
jgi:tRNA U34 5-carboxymethylaminomethyl modifying GTPase MnmE/TrmE